MSFHRSAYRASGQAWYALPHIENCARFAGGQDSGALQSIKPDLQKIREYFGPSKTLADFYYITRDTQDPHTGIR
jgi:hypothetical protein